MRNRGYIEDYWALNRHESHSRSWVIGYPGQLHSTFSDF